MENHLTSPTPSPVTHQGEEESGRMESTTTPDCSIINDEQSTLIPESLENDDSLFVNTGYSGDTEETLTQTPVPQRDYTNSRITGTYVTMSQTPGPAYRLRSRTRELTKPRYMINELIEMVKIDIKEDEKSIKERLEREDEVYSLLGEEESINNQSYTYKICEDIEVDKGKRVQFREVMEFLNTSIGAIVKVEAFEEQEKKLESFKVATEALNMQVKKVKEKGNW